MQINDSFEQLMLDLRSVSQSKSDQGSKFERLMKKYFLTSPLYSEIFEEVWFLFNENTVKELFLAFYFVTV